MSESIIMFQTTVLSKRIMYPGVFILKLQPGITVDMSRGISVEAFDVKGVGIEIESLKRTTAGGKVFPFKFVFSSPTGAQGKDRKRAISLINRKFLLNDFIDTVTKNKPEDPYKLVTCIQPSQMAGPERTKVKKVFLTFYLSDNSSVRTNMISFVQGANEPLRREHTGHNVFAYNQIWLPKLYDDIVGKKSLDDIVRDAIDNELVVTEDDSPRGNYNFRETNKNSKFKPIKMVSSRYITKQNDALFFVMLQSDSVRPYTDYAIESSFIEPYNVGFDISRLGSVETSDLIDAENKAYLGHPFKEYYDILLENNTKYHIIIFKIRDVLLDDNTTPTSLTLSIKLPFNVTLTTQLQIVSDNRYGIVSLHRLKYNDSDVGSVIELNDDDFSNTVAGNEYAWNLDDDNMDNDDSMDKFIANVDNTIGIDDQPPSSPNQLDDQPPSIPFDLADLDDDDDELAPTNPFLLDDSDDDQQPQPPASPFQLDDLDEEAPIDNYQFMDIDNNVEQLDDGDIEISSPVQTQIPYATQYNEYGDPIDSNGNTIEDDKDDDYY
jgi:hypothetical protein